MVGGEGFINRIKSFLYTAINSKSILLQTLSSIPSIIQHLENKFRQPLRLSPPQNYHRELIHLPMGLTQVNQSPLSFINYH